MKRPGATAFAAIVALASGGCDSTLQEDAAPPAEVKQAPRVLEQAPTEGPAAFAIQLASGKWCHGDAGETFFNGNDRLCSKVRADIRIDDDVGAPHRRATMALTYHQPGPVTDDGKVVSWSESDMRFNCETGEMWVLNIVTYGTDKRVILTELQNPPRQGPEAPDLLGIVCGARL